MVTPKEAQTHRPGGQRLMPRQQSLPVECPRGMAGPIGAGLPAGGDEEPRLGDGRCLVSAHSQLVLGGASRQGRQAIPETITLG